MFARGGAPRAISLTGFSMRRPEHQTDQRRSLEWLAEVHVAAECSMKGLGPQERDEFAARIRRVIDRCACGPTKIGSRGHVLADPKSVRWTDMAVYDVESHPRGRDTTVRGRIFDEVVTRYFAEEYARELRAPGDIIHVTCTGYVAPSGAQRLVASKGWGTGTRVTHAYHMGCYAAVPAVRLAAGALHLRDGLQRGADPRVDVVHTELCTLHLDPASHAVEQLVVQSLFADGLIRYSVREGNSAPGLELLALGERILPDSADRMTWTLTDHGMAMTLARDVPERIGSSLRDFMADLCRRAGLAVPGDLPGTVFAVHPGGPRIIDAVRDVLELSEPQVRASREVLFDYGNMSSATLPHVWMRIVDDGSVAAGTPVVSLAFGPGLTVCGGVFRKN